MDAIARRRTGISPWRFPFWRADRAQALGRQATRQFGDRAKFKAELKLPGMKRGLSSQVFVSSHFGALLSVRPCFLFILFIPWFPRASAMVQ